MIPMITELSYEISNAAYYYQSGPPRAFSLQRLNLESDGTEKVFVEIRDSANSILLYKSSEITPVADTPQIIVLSQEFCVPPSASVNIVSTSAITADLKVRLIGVAD